jgi:uncharacterized protein (DUF2236 family)
MKYDGLVRGCWRRWGKNPITLFVCTPSANVTNQITSNVSALPPNVDKNGIFADGAIKNTKPPTNQNPETYGYFGPESATWQIYRESVFLLGGVRALLLQVAHPAIADGVAQFSNFEKDAFGRAFRTFLAMGTLYFGTKTQANSVGDRLFRIHSGITGSYCRREGDAQSLREYTANDPDLLLWVHATLVDTSIRIYEATLGKMPPELAAQFYAESKLAAQIMHVPEAHIPKDLEAFQLYFEQVMQNGDLYQSEYGVATGLAILDHK